MTVGKLGRPKKGESEGEMISITFRVDSETLTALKSLESKEDTAGLPARGKRSIVLRRLILDAAGKR